MPLDTAFWALRLVGTLKRRLTELLINLGLVTDTDRSFLQRYTTLCLGLVILIDSRGLPIRDLHVSLHL